MNTISRSSRNAGVSIVPILIVSIGLLLAACSSPTPATPSGEPTSKPVPADTQTPAEPPKPISKDTLFDPANATNTDSLMLNGYLFEGLVRLDGNTPVPSLATHWTISEDGLTYTFDLRPGVVFHDGTPLTADVVLANFNRWFDPSDPLHGSAAYAAWKDVFLGFKGEVDSNNSPVSAFDGIEKSNNLTILLHLNREMPDLLEKLCEPAFALVSPTALANGGTAGTGPYMLGNRTDTAITLQPNAKYWGAAPDKNLEFTLK